MEGAERQLTRHCLALREHRPAMPMLVVSRRTSGRDAVPHEPLVQRINARAQRLAVVAVGLVSSSRPGRQSRRNIRTKSNDDTTPAMPSLSITTT